MKTGKIMSTNDSFHIVLMAGEASGDLHASKLVKEILKKDGSIKFSGIGGKLMQESGVQCIAGIEEMGVVGLWEVVSRFENVVRNFYLLKNHINQLQPDLFIPVDYPDFNLRLSTRVKKAGIPVIYFISPQLWAWRRSRLRLIKKYVDKMIVILPFEKEFYSSYGLNVEYVGHPLVDNYALSLSRHDARNKLNIPENLPVITIMPGSRKNELVTHYPVIHQAIDLILEKYPDALFPLLLASSLDKQDLAQVGPFHDKLTVQTKMHKEYMAASDVVVTASGTATIEIALSRVPMVIIYKVSPITYLIAKTIIKTPYIGMVNLIAGEKVVPELLQNQATPANIAAEVIKILENTGLKNSITEDLETVINKLGPPGASERAAELVLKFLNGSISGG